MEIDKDEIKKRILEYYSYECGAPGICPFSSLSQRGLPNGDQCLNEYCGTIFPRWKADQEKIKCGISAIHCPCYVLSKDYVVRKFRKWLKE